MTDMTPEHNTGDAQRQRLEQLQRRRTPSTPAAAPAASRQKATRVAPAIGAKIATAGFFTATMFGMVGAMSLAAQAASSNSATAAPEAVLPVASTEPPQVVVVVHHVDANGNPIAQPTAQAPTQGAAQGAAQAPTPAVTKAAPTAVKAVKTPTVLKATPTVRRAPAAAAPVAKSRGSK
jgi:hypothetical protein